jgi:hypothetical protein
MVSIDPENGKVKAVAHPVGSVILGHLRHPV